MSDISIYPRWPGGAGDRPAEAKGWAGPYIEGKSLPLDPWKHPYQYVYPGKHNPDGYDVWSPGPDGLTGTADDIGNWWDSP